MYYSDQRSSRGLWATFAVCALLGAGLFFVPAFIIRPFRYQSPRALWLSMAVHDRAPRWTVFATLVCLLFAVVLWRSSARWGRRGVTIARARVVVSRRQAAAILLL